MGFLSARRARSELAGLQAVLRTPMVMLGYRRVSVFSPQATKTTTLAMVLWVLAEARGDLVVGVDANPDKGKLRMRLCPADTVPPRFGLSDLIARLEQDAGLPLQDRVIRTPADLAPALEDTPARMLRLLSNTTARPDVIAAHTTEQYLAALGVLSDWFAIIGIDIGRSQTNAPTNAALYVADHLLVPWEADGTSMNLVLEAQEDLIRTGYGSLVGACTMVVTGQDPASRPDTALAHLRRYADQRHRAGQLPLWGQVVTVPYDEAAGSVGQIVWDNLDLPTQLAYTQVAAHVARSFAQPPLSRPHGAGQAWLPPAAHGHTASAQPGVVRQLRTPEPRPEAGDGPPTVDGRGLG